MKKILFVLSFALVSIFSATNTQAITRDGFLIGFDIGPSYMRQNDLWDKGAGIKNNVFGAAVSFYLGGSFTPQWALMGMLVGAGGPSKNASGSSDTLSIGFLGPVAQYAYERYLLRFGVGFGSAEYSQPDISVNGNTYHGNDRSGFGGFISPVIELYQSEGRFAMDLNMKAIPMATEGGFAMISSLGLGFSWY
ncbi:MAG: hypothetical protein J0L93_01585 [Deltaproteobacteria bacterium]|nr:hypothetical protein [Deltaproteobacteria bacterium]